jgi:hypothetical protein
VKDLRYKFGKLFGCDYGWLAYHDHGADLQKTILRFRIHNINNQFKRIWIYSRLFGAVYFDFNPQRSSGK